MSTAIEDYAEAGPSALGGAVIHKQSRADLAAAV